MRAGVAHRDDRRVSLYEALSLLVSAAGTLGTVYIGVRQLRPTAPAPSPVASGPLPPNVGPWRASTLRPVAVTAASLLLYTAAAVQPVVFVAYYGIRYATDPHAATRDFGQEGYIDVLGLGAIALVSALLGVFIARRSRVARGLVWALGGASAGVLGLMCVGTLLASLDPDQPALAGGFQLLFFGYVTFICLAYLVGAGLLLAASARSYFRRP
jgi:hypothetical protein